MVIVTAFSCARRGALIREQLLTLSDFDYQCTDSILESPMPKSNYIATLKLTRITDGNRAFAEWGRGIRLRK